MVKKHLKFIFPILLLIGFIVAGTYAYNYVEGWSLLNSLYFVVVTVTTIGYGDVTPITPLGKIFTMFFAFFGITIAFYLFSVIGSQLFRKHISKKVSEIKREVKKQEEIKEDIRDTIEDVANKGKKAKKKK